MDEEICKAVKGAYGVALVERKKRVEDTRLDHNFDSLESHVEQTLLNELMHENSTISSHEQGKFLKEFCQEQLKQEKRK